MAYPENEDPDQQIDSTIIKLAEEYASCDRRSAEINDERKTIRDNAEKLGIPSKAFQHAVGMVKHMSEGERRDYAVGMNRVVRAIEGRQAELFPAEAERIRKRQEKNAKTEAAPVNSDTNPRSNPDAGGAKPMVGDSDKPWPDDVATGAVPPNPPGEQEEGDAALNAGLTETRAKKSQSQIAAEKLEAAKLTGARH